MEERKVKYYLKVGIFFLMLYAILNGIYFGFIRELFMIPEVETINEFGEIVYENINNDDLVDVLVGTAFISIMFTIGFANVYCAKKLKKSEVITELVTIVDKEISFSMLPVTNGSGGQIRSGHAVRFRFPDYIDRSFLVDNDHYMAAMEGDRVLLRYKKYYESYRFIGFEKPDENKLVTMNAQNNMH